MMVLDGEIDEVITEKNASKVFSISLDFKNSFSDRPLHFLL